MTVKELIKRLEEMPQDAPICIEIIRATGSNVHSQHVDMVFESCDDDVVIQGFTNWGAGILCLFTNAITAIIYGIRKATQHKYFKALLVDEEGKLYYCESKDADDIRCDRDLKFAREIVDKYTINDGWRKSDCHKFCNEWMLSARYTPVKICKAIGAEYIK